MDPKKLSGVIMIVAIIVDVLWGFLGNDWGRSWIAVFVGVMLSVIVNIIFKELKCRYGLKIGHFSSHSLRKTFGRRVVEMAGTNSEMALIKLSDIFQHSSVKTTRIYLGLRREELLETYDLLAM